MHGPGHPSDECKVIGGFGTNTLKAGLLKTACSSLKQRINLKEDNSIIQHAVNDNIL